MRKAKHIYNKMFGELLFLHGFKRHQSTFYKVVDDTLQTVMLKATSHDCTVDFNIIPLALGITDLYCEGYDISMLRRDNMKGRSWKLESYSITDLGLRGSSEARLFDDGNVMDILHEMREIVEQHIIPIFQRSTDSKSALSELQKYELSVYGKKLFTSCSTGAFLTNVKYGNYDDAIAYLNHCIAQRTDNPYDKGRVLSQKRKSLIIAKLKYDLVTCDNYQDLKSEILAKDDIDEEIKNQVLANETFYLMARRSNFAKRIKQSIAELEREIAELKNEDSRNSLDIRERSANFVKEAETEIADFRRKIELLSEGKVDEFELEIREKEAISNAFLNSICKTKRSRKDEEGL